MTANLAKWNSPKWPSSLVVAEVKAAIEAVANLASGLSDPNARKPMVDELEGDQHGCVLDNSLIIGRVIRTKTVFRYLETLDQLDCSAV